MSFATDDCHSSPPLLFKNMPNLSHHHHHHYQRTNFPPPAASYPSHDYPHQGIAEHHLMVVPSTHPHASASLFTSSSQPLDMHHHPPQLAATSSQPWPVPVSAYDQTLAGYQQQGMSSLPYHSYTGSSPYPPSRITPPPPPGTANNLSSSGSQHGGSRLALAGSLDPSTGIFYRTPEHPRLRTAQACEKCRTRKAKCTGDHPSCKRCQSRGLVCEYAKEGRVRGPNKPKNKAAAAAAAAAVAVEEQRNYAQRNQIPASPRHIDHHHHHHHRPTAHVDLSQEMINALREHDKNLSLSMMPRRNSLSMGEHRANRPRPPNLNLDVSNNHFRLNGFQQQPDAANFNNAMSQNDRVVGQYIQDEQVRFNEGSPMVHATPQIPVSYQGMHVHPSPNGLPLDDHMEAKYSSYAYDERRSPSTSSSASMQGHHSNNGNPSMLHLQNAYMQGMPQQLSAEESQLRIDHSSASSSPVYGTSSEMGSSPTVAVPSMLHLNRHNGGNNNTTSFENMHLDLNKTSTSTIDSTSVSLSLDPAWVDQRYQHPHPHDGRSGTGDQNLMNGQVAPGVLRHGIPDSHYPVGAEVVGDGDAQVSLLYPVDLSIH